MHDQETQIQNQSGLAKPSTKPSQETCETKEEAEHLAATLALMKLSQARLIAAERSFKIKCNIYISHVQKFEVTDANNLPPSCVLCEL